MNRSRTTPGSWSGRVFLDTGLILYIGPGATAAEHAHNAVQFVWSLDESHAITIGRRRLERTALLIPAHTTHALEASGRVIALLLVESHGARGIALDEAARRERHAELAGKLGGVPFPTHDLEARDAAPWCDRVLGALGVIPAKPTITATTRRAIEHIERNLDRVPRVADVARELSLSTTRVTHSFSNEIGIPFRRFVLWTRIKRAVAAHQQGGDLTTAAIAAGFSDAAHFSRTFRSMFGLSPSLVLPVAEVVGSISQ